VTLVCTSCDACDDFVVMAGTTVCLKCQHVVDCHVPLDMVSRTQLLAPRNPALALLSIRFNYPFPCVLRYYISLTI
jgi:hypothetical protein